MSQIWLYNLMVIALVFALSCLIVYLVKILTENYEYFGNIFVSRGERRMIRVMDELWELYRDVSAAKVTAIEKGETSDLINKLATKEKEVWDEYNLQKKLIESHVYTNRKHPNYDSILNKSVTRAVWGYKK